MTLERMPKRSENNLLSPPVPTRTGLGPKQGRRLIAWTTSRASVNSFRAGLSSALNQLSLLPFVHSSLSNFFQERFIWCREMWKQQTWAKLFGGQLEQFNLRHVQFLSLIQSIWKYVTTDHFSSPFQFTFNNHDLQK